MHDLRVDIAPLPIAELAPIRFESSDPGEPFVLGTGGAPANGHNRSDLLAVRRTGGTFIDAAGADVRVVITPCGVVRTASIDGVVVTERVAAIGDPARPVTQWSVDADADLVLRGFGSRRFAAGETATVFESALPLDVARAFRAAAADLARAVAAGLQVETSGPAGRALAWAKARLWLHARARPAPTLATSLAALVTGQPVLGRSSVDTAPLDLFPLLAARYAAATADRYVASLRDRLRAATDAMVCTPARDDAAAVIRLAGLTELERTAADIGEPAYAAQLRSAAAQARAGLSRALDPHAAAVLAALRATEPRTLPARWTETEHVAQYAWFTWAALEQGSLSDGLRAWLRLVAEADAPVRGAWPSRFGALGDDAEAAALFVLTLAHGVLGIEPDAARSRLRLAPRLDVAVDRLEVHGIPCGDASISLTLASDDSAVTLRLVQDAGAVPVTAVLEPLIAGHVTATVVDGRSAALQRRVRGEGSVVPVQLVLDSERTLRVERAPRG